MKKNLTITVKAIFYKLQTGPLTTLSLGLKSGLAAGLVYAAMLGAQHFFLLASCSTAQIRFISQSPLLQNSNQTAEQIFSYDLVFNPLSVAIIALVLGVVYGALFSYSYRRLPGGTSKSKGLFMALLVFVIGLLLAISGLEIGCDSAWIPFVGMGVSLAISAGYGYILGIFYDSFGRLEKEQREDPRNFAPGKPDRPLQLTDVLRTEQLSWKKH